MGTGRAAGFASERIACASVGTRASGDAAGVPSTWVRRCAISGSQVEASARRHASDRSTCAVLTERSEWDCLEIWRVREVGKGGNAVEQNAVPRQSRRRSDLLPSGHGRAARHRAPRFTASELWSQYAGDPAGRKPGSLRAKKLRVHVLAHADVVQQIPARVIRVLVDDELVARPAPGRGDRPIPVRDLEHAAWQPDAPGRKVKASDLVEVRRADEPEVPKQDWVREVEARIVGRGGPIPVVIPDVWRPGGRSSGLGEWRRVAGPASHRLVRDDRPGS